ncbi:putative RNA methyltransferase [Vermiculatibacterium agrestimuris]|uniref:putative RNA methyltransferase n=1 Tax=Vermiculatibacterium agrestimuris TaxID=2941519 RepID=UPI002041A23E|nr:methyltransferase domain-containing protein [Vermiculatibacterium agrestimuris]
MDSLFACPICGEGLCREAGRYACPGGHSFDIAREGYVNLLPANRQHSKAPGDDGEMTAARTRFLSGGWYSPLREALCALVERYAPERPALLDAGCGEGWYTAALAQVSAARGGRTAGVDLSKPAVKKAARQCPNGEIAVASVYHLPLGDGSVDVLTDCFSPLGLEEFYRVLKPGGIFLYVVPGPRHLWELKSVLYENPYENEEKREEYSGFRYIEVVPVETSFTLPGPQAIADLYRMTPYCWKTPKEGARRLAELNTLSLTGQFRIHVLERL